MIVPSSRLVWWCAAALLPLWAASPLLRFPAEPVAFGLALVAVADGWAGWRRRRRVAMEPAAMVRTAKGRPYALPCRFRIDGRGIRRLRLALSLPPGLSTDLPRIEVRRLEASPVASVAWPMVARRTGLLRVRSGAVEMASPLGFWDVRKRIDLAVEVRCYPNLFADTKRLAGLLHDPRMGIHAQRVIGKGREFEQLRDYVPGDSYQDIHWKATAKRNHPVTKIFQVERTQEIYVAVDASRLGARRPTEGPGSPEGADTACERYVTAALVLGRIAQRQGDRFGLVTFDDQVRRFLPAGAGSAHFRACLDTLFTLSPKRVSPDFNDLFTFVANRIPKRSLVIFLTHLDDPVLAENFVDHVDLICRKHLVMATMLKPGHADPLFGGEPVQAIDDIYRALAGHETWQRLRDIGKRLARRGVGFTQARNEGLAHALVVQYLMVKQRQLL